MVLAAHQIQILNVYKLRCACRKIIIFIILSKKNVKVIQEKLVVRVDLAMAEKNL